jgi:hypothetical protein
MNTKLTTLLFLAATLTAIAQDPPCPCCPNCPTNTWEPPVFETPAYTNGELAARVVGLADNVLTISVTNVSPFKLYELQFSADMPVSSWTTATGKAIGNTNQILFNVISGDLNGFFRVADVTGDDLIVYPTYGGGGASGSGCPGTHVSYWVYRPADSIFPFQPVGTNHSVIDPTGSTDTRIEMLGRFGDQQCGASPLTLPGILDDPYYGLTVYFKTVAQGTNYPLVLKGFVIRTDL